MGYIPKALLQKAYKSLSNLTDDHLQGQTQTVSAIRHLFALDMFCEENGTDECDLKVAANKTKFVNCVRKIVIVNDNNYTTNFYTTIKKMPDCGVGSNFYSAGVVNNSKQNTSNVYDYPTRGQYPLFKVKNNVLIRDVDYYENIDNYLNTAEIQNAFLIWLLRKEEIDSLNEDDISAALKNIFSEELIDSVLSEDNDIEDYVSGFSLTDNQVELNENDCLSLFNEISAVQSSKQDGTKYRPFLTAIRSKPFLLLAGISGTGKSRIVRELARACWDSNSEEYKAQKPKNFEMIQVKPNWHDSTELIGYVSRASGAPEFVAGDFLKFVVKAWENPETPYFLCLDEMNLAPVEQYFAEYLSVIESRKFNGKEVITDPILKKTSDPWFHTFICLLTQDGNLQEQFLQFGISIPQNLIVIGTVNMDETTFAFSRKVLDRAMTIEMNEVDLHGGLTEKTENIGKINFDTVVGNAVEGVDVYANNQEVCDTAINYLQSINDKLNDTPFKIAYRTRNEFLLYVVNNLPYVKDENGNDLDQNYVIARALDEITSMKILSRIEGDEDKTRTVIEDLKKVIESGLKAVCDSFDTTNSVSLPKLNEMEKRLSSGYTNFWS